MHSREKKESNHEEMDVDFAEQEGSSSEDEDTESSSVSEDGESSGANDSLGRDIGIDRYMLKLQYNNHAHLKIE